MAFINDNGYVIVELDGRQYREHRLIWELYHGPIPAGYEIDHANGVRHDNRIENLRLATRAQNGWNHKVHKHNKSGIKGVRLRRRGNCVDYCARITANKVLHRKYFKTAVEAVEWLNAMRVVLHGQFATDGKRRDG